MTNDRLLVGDHDHYWFETLRVLGHTAYGGAGAEKLTMTRVLDWPEQTLAIA